MTQIEINKHKTNIYNLAMKLSNTFNIYEEISINNEIKKETEFLESLLNITSLLDDDLNKKNKELLKNNDFNKVNNLLLKIEEKFNENINEDEDCDELTDYNNQFKNIKYNLKMLI